MSKNLPAIRKPPLDLVTKILSLTRDGLNREQIHQWALELPESPDADLVDASLAEAANVLIDAGKIDPEIEAGRSIARLNDLYARLHQTGDLRGCLSVQKELTTMLGLASSVKRQNEKKVEAIKRITMEIVNIADQYMEIDKKQPFIEAVKVVLKKGGLI